MARIYTLSNFQLSLFLICFIGFFILAACVLKYVHERRLRARLQQELNGLLYDYVALEGNEIETITFINDQSRLTGPNPNSSNSNVNRQSFYAPSNNRNGIASV